MPAPASRLVGRAAERREREALCEITKKESYANENAPFRPFLLFLPFFLSSSVEQARLTVKTFSSSRIG